LRFRASIGDFLDIDFHLIVIICVLVALVLELEFAASATDSCVSAFDGFDVCVDAIFQTCTRVVEFHDFVV
jgi:hypothetical protein